MTARVDVLSEGYVGDRVAGTVVLIREEDAIIVVDPGMVARRDLILEPLHRHGIDEDDVTDIIFSHHHPDHTLNAALFRHARVHDVWAIYHDDVWDERTDSFEGAPSLTLLDTPGHTPRTSRRSSRPTRDWSSAPTSGGPVADPWSTPSRATRPPWRRREPSSCRSSRC